MRAELDRSDATAFDLKQGEGGLVDLEFALQAQVLVHAAAHPGLVASRTTRQLLDAMRASGLADEHVVDAAADAHAVFVARGLDCTLDRRARRVALSGEIDAARAAVRKLAESAGLRF
jgi:glutamate-ammonia-ligase adenylyltransferase